jgi:hypothetical protein
MRTRDFIIVSICILLTAGLLIAAGLQLEPINSQRQEMKLVIDKPENIPPTLAFATVATGAFRGLLVDFLWIRADRLKEAGQFFDAKQLAEWITILQPRFASVWEFQAWNMAYNISVAIPETQPEQRWLWVRNGYELIRDQAIDKYKLKDIGLYHEIARIFQHKIGGVSDEDHKYYKLQLAMQMQPLVSRSGDVPFTNEDFDLLAQAPATWQEIIRDANVAEFVNALKSADSKFTEESGFVGNYLSLRQNASRYNEDAGKVIDRYRGSDILKKFDYFAKAYQLTNLWKLDPVMMCKINKMYGPVEFSSDDNWLPEKSDKSDLPDVHLPMDWRLADSHAIYWAEKGLEVATLDSQGKPRATGEGPHDIGSDETNTDRIVFHSLQNLFRMGKMIIFETEVPVPSSDPSLGPQTTKARQVFLRPDVRYFKPYNDYMLKMLKKYDNDANRGTYQTIQDGHRNMLKNAVFLFYQSGHKEQAQNIYNYMKKLYPLPEFDVPLKEYATSRLLEELRNFGFQDAMEQVTAILREGYYYLSIDDDDSAASSESTAKEIYDYYISLNRGSRIDLPDFNILKASSLRDFLNDEQFPEYLRSRLINKIQILNPGLYKLLVDEEKKKNQKTE